MQRIYRRAKLAEEIASTLLRPSALQDGVRSGLFLSGIRRIGKSTFLKQDLMPRLIEEGAIVVYVDLWSDPGENPSDLVHLAVRTLLEDLKKNPASAFLEPLKQIKGLALGGAGFNIGIDIQHLGQKGGPTLANVLLKLVDTAKTDVVVIIDEVQHALASDDGNNLMLSLKAARDAINTRPDTPGYMLFLGTGSHRAMVGEMAMRRNQAFAGAMSQEFPRLGAEYVRFLLDAMREDGITHLPSFESTVKAFESLGNRPEELKRALGVLMEAVDGDLDPDEHLPTVTKAFRERAAEVELAKIDELGLLASEVYGRIARAGDKARGLYSAPALMSYQEKLGRPVGTDEVQAIIRKMQAANLVMSMGHGVYATTDPFVQAVWIKHSED